MSQNEDKLNIQKDIYNLRIKSTIAGCQKTGFEKFLIEHIKAGMSPNDIFDNVILGSLQAIYYSIKNKDEEILKLAKTLREVLENERSDPDDEIMLAKKFNALLKKAENVYECGSDIHDILNVFEFKHFGRAFIEKITTQKNTIDHCEKDHYRPHNFSKN